MKQFLLTILFFGTVYSLSAQNTCTQQLNQAEDDYQGGKLLGIPEKLKDCLDGGGFSTEEEKRARKLLTLVYIFTDQEKEAEKAMINLLKVDEEHQLNPKVDPAEIFFLYNQFRVAPIFRMALRVGANTSYVNVIQERGTGSGEYPKVYNGKQVETEQSGEAETEAQFAPEGGIGVGLWGELLIERHLGQGVELAFGPQVRMSNYNVDSFLPASLETALTNRQINLRTPLFVRYNLWYNDRDKKFIPYVFAGGSFDYLVKAEYSSFSRNGGISYTLPESESDLTKTGKVNRKNFSLTGGIGTKIRMKTNFLTLEFRYDTSMGAYTNGNNAYAYQNSAFNGAFVEDDLSLDFISFSVGYTRSFYKPVKIK